MTLGQTRGDGAGAPPAAGESQLRRGLRVLELLARHPAGASAVARALGVNRSTALRLLQELEAAGYVVRDSRKHYSTISERLLALVGDHRDHSDWMELINPILSTIRDEFEEATNFSVPADGSMVYMSYYPSPHPVAVRERAGAVRPMHCSGIGKAYLASLEAAALDAALARLGFRGGTANAARGPLELRARLDEARRLGYAVDREETAIGATCVATVVRIGGAAIGAAGISAPTTRLPEELVHHCGRYLVEAFDELGTSRR
jgi:IclR family acetate operon transcriptional repressor